MLNQAQIIGHLGRDPEIRYLPNGDAVASLAIATTEKWKDKNTGEQKKPPNGTACRPSESWPKSWANG